MSKRFTDSRKWFDPWFRKLPIEYKAFWMYVLDTCDHAGIWKGDFELAEFSIGAELPIKNIKEVFNERITELKSGNWFIPKFIEFQYTELNPDNRVHKSVIDLLTKEGAYKGLIRTMEGCKDYNKDKDKDKDNIKGKIFRPPTLEQVTEYCKEIKASIKPETFFDNYESTNWVKANGQSIKNWKATVRTWESKQEPSQKKGTVDAL